MRRTCTFLLLAALAAFLLAGCGGDDSPTAPLSDPGGGDDPDAIPLDLPEDYVGHQQRVLLGPPGKCAAKDGDELVWNPWDDPVSPTINGVRLEVRNLAWDVAKDDSFSIIGEYRVCSVEDQMGNAYLLNCRVVSLPEFITGHIGAQLPALMPGDESIWQPLDLRSSEELAFEIVLELSWTDEVICTTIDFLNEDTNRLIKQIVLLDPGSHRLYQVTDVDDRGFYYAALSADGRHIVSVNDRTNPGRLFDVFIVGSDGRNLYNLTDDDSREFWMPCLSPDNETVYFAQGGSWHQIYRVQASGAGDPQLVSDPSIWESTPSVSPDGTRLAYMSSDQDGGLFIRDLASNECELIVPGSLHNPVWSPVGDRICYAVMTAEDSRILACDADGNNITEVIGDQADYDHWQMFFPSYSPDGTRILFSGTWMFGAHREWALFTVPAEGGAPTQITETMIGYGTGRATWGPWLR